jgi:isopenicillin N synthase-like dioxygenase
MIDVPVIDLGGAPDAVAAAIDNALHRVGFMAVTGHGVDPALVAAMFDAADEFFSLPTSEKMLAAPTDPASPRGYSYLGSTAQANAHDEDTKPDLAETFNAGLDDVPDTQYYREAAAFFPPNLWPTRPERLPAVWSRYLAAMQDLSGRILSSMASALGLPGDHFTPLIDRPMASITVNRYPSLDREPEPNEYRGGAHTDYGTITLLATDGVPGLQLQDELGEWVHVQPVPGAFHVNTGDMLSYWSGGHWKSTWHRVVTPPGPPPYPRRTSIAYFHSPNADALIEPLPGRSPAAGADIEPVLAGRYLHDKIARYHAARATTSPPP